MWRPLSAFIIKQGLCFRPIYERRFPCLKVTCSKRHAAWCYICSIIKVNIFLSLQCLFFFYPDLHQLRAALLQQHCLPYTTGCTRGTALNPTGIHPSTRMHCVHLVSRGKEEKTLNHPPCRITIQELRAELQIELIQWIHLS